MTDNRVVNLSNNHPLGATYSGADKFIHKCISRNSEFYSDFNVETIAFYESCKTVFMHGKISAGGLASGTIYMSKVRDGKVREWKGFDDISMKNSEAILRS